MVMCFVPDCKHYSEKHTCRFFHFPRQGEILRKWIIAIRRADREPSQHSSICSCHFVDGIKKNGPTIFQRDDRSSVLYSKPRQNRKRKKILLEDISETSDTEGNVAAKVPCNSGRDFKDRKIVIKEEINIEELIIKEEDASVHGECSGSSGSRGNPFEELGQSYIKEEVVSYKEQCKKHSGIRGDAHKDEFTCGQGYIKEEVIPFTEQFTKYNDVRGDGYDKEYTCGQSVIKEELVSETEQFTKESDVRDVEEGFACGQNYFKEEVVISEECNLEGSDNEKGEEFGKDLFFGQKNIKIEDPSDEECDTPERYFIKQENTMY